MKYRQGLNSNLTEFDVIILIGNEQFWRTLHLETLVSKRKIATELIALSCLLFCRINIFIRDLSFFKTSGLPLL